MRRHPLRRNPRFIDGHDTPALYEFRIRGVLSERELEAFPDLAAVSRDGDTVLAGTLPDQAALFGVLAQIEALALELLDVRRSPR